VTDSAFFNSAPTAAPRPALAAAVVCEDAVTGRRIADALRNGGIDVCAIEDSERGLAFDAIADVDVVVVGCDLRASRQLTSLRRLRESFGEIGIVLVAAGSGPGSVREAVNVGADGFVVNSDLEATLAVVVRTVAAGQVCVPRDFRRAIVAPSFSYRERQVLALMAHGLHNREIADRLYLAESTVKSHLTSSFAKLGVGSRKEAAALMLDPDNGVGAIVLGGQPLAADVV
jgi:DNA-binding NarL/FixJ family response regulator